jgi:hypothetical protein
VIPIGVPRAGVSGLSPSRRDHHESIRRGHSVRSGAFISFGPGVTRPTGIPQWDHEEPDSNLSWDSLSAKYPETSLNHEYLGIMGPGPLLVKCCAMSLFERS